MSIRLPSTQTRKWMKQTKFSNPTKQEQGCLVKTGSTLIFARTLNPLWEHLRQLVLPEPSDSESLQLPYHSLREFNHAMPQESTRCINQVFHPYQMNVTVPRSYTPKGQHPIWRLTIKSELGSIKQLLQLWLPLRCLAHISPVSSFSQGRKW